MFKIIKKHKASLLAGILEITIIFVGISISLYIDDWREENDNREKEAVYLEELYYDITDDMIALNLKINFINTIKNRIEIVLGSMHYPDSISITPLDLKQSIARSMILENFVSKDYTFKDLTSTGNMKLIDNKKIRKSIYAYFSKAEQVYNVEDINNKATSEVLTNDLMKVFPLRQLFDYSDWYTGVEKMTEMDISFFSDSESEKYVRLENALLFRASLLRFQIRAYSSATFEGITLRKLLGDFLGVPDEKGFIEEVIKGDMEASELLEKYRKRFPEYTLIETPINEITYEILPKHPEKALSLFKMNAELYPDSGNVFDSLGDGYLANGDEENALKNFKKAYEMDPLLMETKLKMEKLENDLKNRK